MGSPKLTTPIRASELPAERLLRSALDRIDLPIERRSEIDLIVEKAGCVTREVENDAPRSGRRDMALLEPCRQASSRLIDILSDEERGKYYEARSLLARDLGATAAEVWVLGRADTPEVRRVLLGATDGLMTEVASGELREGDRVIVGAETDPTKPAGPTGF